MRAPIMRARFAFAKHKGALFSRRVRNVANDTDIPRSVVVVASRVAQRRIAASIIFIHVNVLRTHQFPNRRLAMVERRETFPFPKQIDRVSFGKWMCQRIATDFVLVAAI